MSGSVTELYSGGARLLIVHGRPLDWLSEGFYTGANARGVMGAGLQASLRRAAGADIERELRAQAPLSLGEAYLTGAGQLVGEGVTAIAHGVVVPEPGGSATLETSINALLDGLRLLEDAGCRSVTVPQAGWRISSLDERVVAAELARVVVTHLRRRSKLDQVTIIASHQEYLGTLVESLKKSGAHAYDGEAGIAV